jgi:DtxR family transcriptional regulator, Mn-dependent transcriptional regulator
MDDTAHLSASLEDYLEAIYQIVNKRQAVRAKDIAAELGVKAPSVTGALRMLAEKSLINYAPYDIITLTDEGNRLARDVVKRHSTLHHFLKDILGLDEQESQDGACKLEHAISPAVLERLISFIDFVQHCPRVGTQWIQEFNTFCQRGTMGTDCKDCINDCLKKVTPRQ